MRRREGPTRRPMQFFDRVKILLLLVTVAVFLWWHSLSENPLLSVRDATHDLWTGRWWLLALAGLELLRQLHYVVSEHSVRWHHLVAVTIFGRWNRRIERLNPWTRFRIARAIKVLCAIALFGVIFGAIWDVTPFEAVFQAPGRIGRYLFSTAAGLPFIFQLLLIMTIAVGQFVMIFWFLSRGGIDTYFPEDIATRFSDVWGQDPVLERVQENLVFLEEPDKIEEKGGYVPGGILLWGPPGTGKTLIAEAVAGETGRPFVFVDPGAFINMFFGVGILKVKRLFRKLRKLALRYGGVIVFFDEADTLGNRGGAVAGNNVSPLAALSAASCNGLNYMSSAGRSAFFHLPSDPGDDDPPTGRVRRLIMGAGMGGGGGMGTLQALLTELSGLKKPRGFFNRHARRALGMKPKPPPKYRILVIMATNLPDVLDPALLRPGRIDRVYEVGYPSTPGRERTYRGYLDKINHVLTDDQIHKLALISRRGTGASIKDIVNEALVVAIRDGRDTVTYRDMITAKHLKEHGPADDWKYSDWEGHAVAVHEACHAIANHRLMKREAIDVATIERRGGVGGFVAPVPLEDQFTAWRSELERDVMVSLASLAGERMFFGGDNSLGVGGDLANSTRVVMQMLGFAGMGENVASHAATLALIGRRQSTSVETGADRAFLETEFGRQVDRKLHELLSKVHALLEEDRIHVLAVAHALETHKAISGDDIVAIVEGGEGPVVDGRRYHDPDVRREIEEYHASVVAAMAAITPVELPLPVLNGHGPGRVGDLAAFQPPIEAAREEEEARPEGNGG